MALIASELAVWSELFGTCLAEQTAPKWVQAKPHPASNIVRPTGSYRPKTGGSIIESGRSTEPGRFSCKQFANDLRRFQVQLQSGTSWHVSWGGRATNQAALAATRLPLFCIPTCLPSTSLRAHSAPMAPTERVASIGFSKLARLVIA